MKITCTINGRKRTYDVNESQRLRDFLDDKGYIAVRDSDNAEGFAGTDTILLNGKPVYSNLVLVGEIDEATILTPDGVANGRKLSIIQQALIDSGVVQSAYNAPAAALLLTWLMNKNPNPSKEEIKEALSGIFIRDAGYEHYYLAVKLAQEMMKNGTYTSEIAPSFRDDLRIVGKPVSKVDGPQLVAGRKAFVGDKADKDALQLYLLRSPYASAVITSMDTSEAEALDGVELIITPFNCPEVYYTQAGQGAPEPSPHDRKLFNQKVRHWGDRVAGIVAETRELAEKAAGLIKINYEVLQPIFTVEEAMAEDAPIVHNEPVEYMSGAPDNLDEYNIGADKRAGKIVYPFPLHSDSRHNVASNAHGKIGDVDKAFKESDKVIERTYQTSQIQCTPLEPHDCFAYVEAERLVIHASTQVPWHLRRVVGTICGIPENLIHVVKERTGGAYGSKQDVLIEDVTGYAAWILGKPVRYRNTRAEEFFANSTRHPMKIKVKLAGNKDGKITAIEMDVRANTGPYGNHCLTVPMNACSKTLPLMAVDNMKFNVTTYYTNIPPTGAYQGYGAPKGAYALMTCIAELADALGVDYLDMIKKNHVNSGYMLEILRGLGEGREGNVVPVGSCGLDKALEKGAKMIHWGEKSDTKLGPNWKTGKGFAIIQQGSGLPGLDHSTALAKLTTDGNLILLSGGTDLGTGLDTVSAKVASEVLCLPIERISVVSGDTDATAFETGAYASSGTYFSGGASLLAAKNLKAKILKEASLQMEENLEDLDIRMPGEVFSEKTGKILTYATLSHDALTGTGRGQLIAQGSFTTNANSIPYGAHFAEVAVNEETGEVKVLKFYAIQDAGTPINPEMALCQMYGAALKSIGHSLYEEMVLDKNGKCINANLTDYGVPSIYEQPEDFKAVLLDICDEYGPYGAKSISEIATNGAAPALAIAIHNAVGVWMREWPFTPEKILKELKRI